MVHMSIFSQERVRTQKIRRPPFLAFDPPCMYRMAVHKLTCIYVCWQIRIMLIWLICLFMCERERQRQMFRRRCMRLRLCWYWKLICSACVLLWQWGMPRARNVALDKALIYWSHTHSHTHTHTHTLTRALQLMVTGRSKSTSEGGEMKERG